MQQFQRKAALQPPQLTQAIMGPNQSLDQGQFTNQQPQKDYSGVMVASQSQMNPVVQVDQRVNRTNVVLGSIIQMNAIAAQSVVPAVQLIKRGTPPSPQEQHLLDMYPKIAPFHIEIYPEDSEGDPETISSGNLLNAVTTSSMAREAEKSNQAQIPPDGNHR
uniref:Uncharacterized protein n=1 Tax=Romanomermis culicivorax TaxID=13658 RepID=A0A915KGR0_ROMCU